MAAERPEARRLDFLGASERLGTALVLLLTVGIAAVTTGALSASLPLLTNGAWVAMLIVAWRLSGRPPHGRLTFGLRTRAPHLVQFVIGIVSACIGAVAVFVGVRRLIAPTKVDAGAVLIAGAVGAVVVAFCAWLLARSDETGAAFTLGVAFRQLRTEVVSFLLAGAGAVLILAFGWSRSDALAGLCVAFLVLRDAAEHIRESGAVLLNAAPTTIDVSNVGIAMVSLPHVTEVHDLHIWQVAEGFPALSAHVLIANDADSARTLRTLEEMIGDRFAIFHTTFQVEYERGDLIRLEIPQSPISEPRRSVACGPLECEPAAQAIHGLRHRRRRRNSR